MKKTFLTLIAVIAMLFAYSSCVVSSNNNDEEQKGPDNGSEKETKVPESLADLVGESFIYYESTSYTKYVYVKDAKTLSFLQKEDGNDSWWTEDSEVGDDGRFYNEIVQGPTAMKIADGRFFMYFSEVCYRDVWACEKDDDDKEALTGTWMYWESWAENPHPKKYVITEDKITEYYVSSYSDTETEDWTKNYTLKEGLLLDSDNNIIAYYDGENLHTNGIRELTKITDSAKAEEIKKAALGENESEDDEGGDDPDPAVPDNPNDSEDPEEPEEQLYKGEEKTDPVLAKNAGYVEIKTVEDFDTVRRVICDGTNIIKTNLGYNIEATKATYKIMNDIDVTGKWNKLNVYGKDFEGVIDGQGIPKEKQIVLFDRFAKIS